MSFLANLGLSVLPTVIGGLFSSSNNKRNVAAQMDANEKNLQAVRETNQANFELAKYQYDQNLEQWNRENEYNSPESQMARLRGAGLNPALVYGTSANTLAASSPQFDSPTYESPHMDAVKSADVWGSVVQTMTDNFYRQRQLEYQSELSKSQVDLNKARVAVELANAKNMEIKNSIEAFGDVNFYNNTMREILANQGHISFYESVAARWKQNTEFNRSQQSYWEAKGAEVQNRYVETLIDKIEEEKSLIPYQKRAILNGIAVGLSTIEVNRANARWTNIKADVDAMVKKFQTQFGIPMSAMGNFQSLMYYLSKPENAASRAAYIKTLHEVNSLGKPFNSGNPLDFFTKMYDAKKSSSLLLNDTYNR